MNASTIKDAHERERARNPEHSVIVQAPAGSGKTELLMQRYLALLANVDEPEEILAVTFTRKAAAEMRQRILQALRPDNDDQRLPETILLAEAALKQNHKQGWQLLEYPARLRIRTLDAVNSWLADSAPLSGDRAASGIVPEELDELYEQAARQALELLTVSSDIGDQLALIIGHLGNRAELFIALMSQMLQRRDQWLPLLGKGDFSGDVRALLESTLHNLVTRELCHLDLLLADSIKAELCCLLPYAAGQNARLKPDQAVSVWNDHYDFPVADADELAYWQEVARLLLTQAGKFRKSVNKTTGFPTPKDGGDADLTNQAKALLAECAGNDQLEESLALVLSLPQPVYSDDQWRVLAAMLKVLPLVAAQLLLVFREQGKTDYIQIAREAISALKDEDGPTGLALGLDYRIQHILIDEFQDTSYSQYELLEALTEGWSHADGHTLFVVGDPMQSIYRFRQAEVGLFLRIWRSGIANLQLERVRLSTNFRSDPTIVNWVNATFERLMPARDDAAIGAVKFAPGSAYKEPVAGSGVDIHVFEKPSRVDEARQIAGLVEDCLAATDDDTVGILVRTRHQARLIVPELRRRNISFSGAGLELPGATAVEQDLIALTRALSHLGDRTAWLAILRAPWCGLSLVDIERLCAGSWSTPVWNQMQDTELAERLSEDGQKRLSRLVSELQTILARRGDQSLCDWVQGAWQQLGGPAALADPRDLSLAEQFFTTLDKYDEGGAIAEAFMLHERLADRVDQDEHSQVRVHLLTLYKAKGLEFDSVILPALDGITRQDDKAVMAWHHLAGETGGHLMAPIESPGAEADPVHQLIRQFESQQASYELDRLLYVATTRARKNLHLCFELSRNAEDELSDPRKGSLLNRLWPVIKENYSDYEGPAGTEEVRDEWLQPKIRRFPVDWALPEPDKALAIAQRPSGQQEDQPVTFDWVGTDAMRVGSVVHRCLQYIASQQLSAWTDREVVQQMLKEEGVAGSGLVAATAKVMQALESTLQDEQGRRILSAHDSALNEYPLTVVQDGEIKRLIIDRTYVDEAGIRWIIDYKTSIHEGSNLDGFIAQEAERYADQLHRYREAMQLLEPAREIKTALYFPLLRVFREL